MTRPFLACLLLAACGTSLTAQTPKPSVRTDPTRIAVVNIGYVFAHGCNPWGWWRTDPDTADFFSMRKRLQTQAEKHAENLKYWEQVYMDRDFASKSEAEVLANISKAKKDLKDVSSELERQSAKYQEARLVKNWKDMQVAIAAYAEHHNIHLVLGYGEPMEKELLDQIPNINRKMQAMDLGSTVTLSASSKMDISEGVVEWMRKKRMEKNK